MDVVTALAGDPSCHEVPESNPAVVAAHSEHCPLVSRSQTPPLFDIWTAVQNPNVKKGRSLATRD